MEHLEGADLVVPGHAHEDHTAGLCLFPETPLYVPEQDRYAVESIDGMLRHYGYAPARGGVDSLLLPLSHATRSRSPPRARSALIRRLIQPLPV